MGFTTMGSEARRGLGGEAAMEGGSLQARLSGVEAGKHRGQGSIANRKENQKRDIVKKKNKS